MSKFWLALKTALPVTQYHVMIWYLYQGYTKLPIFSFYTTYRDPPIVWEIFYAHESIDSIFSCVTEFLVSDWSSWPALLNKIQKVSFLWLFFWS